jgi:hypothetical protein
MAKEPSTDMGHNELEIRTVRTVCLTIIGSLLILMAAAARGCELSTEDNTVRHKTMQVCLQSNRPAADCRF